MNNLELRLMVVRNRIVTLTNKGPHNTALVKKLQRRERLLMKAMGIR